MCAVHRAGRGPQGANLYVNNLTAETSQQDLQTMFGEYGTVTPHSPRPDHACSMHDPAYIHTTFTPHSHHIHTTHAKVLSLKVFPAGTTGFCYGFVSFDDSNSAQVTCLCVCCARVRVRLCACLCVCIYMCVYAFM